MENFASQSQECEVVDFSSLRKSSIRGSQELGSDRIFLRAQRKCDFLRVVPFVGRFRAIFQNFELLKSFFKWFLKSRKKNLCVVCWSNLVVFTKIFKSSKFVRNCFVATFKNASGRFWFMIFWNLRLNKGKILQIRFEPKKNLQYPLKKEQKFTSIVV